MNSRHSKNIPKFVTKNIFSQFHRLQLCSLKVHLAVGHAKALE